MQMFIDSQRPFRELHNRFIWFCHVTFAEPQLNTAFQLLQQEVILLPNMYLGTFYQENAQKKRVHRPRKTSVNFEGLYVHNALLKVLKLLCNRLASIGVYSVDVCTFY